MKGYDPEGLSLKNKFEIHAGAQQSAIPREGKQLAIQYRFFIGSIRRPFPFIIPRPNLFEYPDKQHLKVTNRQIQIQQVGIDNTRFDKINPPGNRGRLAFLELFIKFAV